MLLARRLVVIEAGHELAFDIIAQQPFNGGNLAAVFFGHQGEGLTSL